MTKVIKVDCHKLSWTIGIIFWLTISILPIYGIQLTMETLSTFTEDGDCHTALSTHKIVCISVFNKDKNAYGQDIYHVSTKEDFIFYLNALIVTEIAIQVVGFLILNIIKKWIVIECKSKEKINNTMSEDA